MYGLGDEFEYLRCATCGCRHIVTVPANLEKYYPSDYYAYAPTPLTGLRGAVTRLRNGSYFGRRRSFGLGKLVAAVLPNPALASVARLRLRSDARILDVGCGYGELLLELRSLGFSRLAGVDPFTAATAETHEGISIRKAGVESLSNETYDLIMMHHVFEHVPDPVATLRAVARLLAPGGISIIRIPVGHSWASQHYGEHWMQHDAPRHLFLHSEDSMRRVADEAGLEVAEVVYDSSEAQFWGSELYRNDVSLLSMPPGVYGNPIRRLFSPTFVRYRRAARRLNRERKGDQAAFYLKKT
jgi:SAM-dependent methyltransferase